MPASEPVQVTLPPWVSDIVPVLKDTLAAVLNVLANFDWSKLFPGFSGLINSIIAMLHAFFGIDAPAKATP